MTLEKKDDKWNGSLDFESPSDDESDESDDDSEVVDAATLKKQARLRMHRALAEEKQSCKREIAIANDACAMRRGCYRCWGL